MTNEAGKENLPVAKEQSHPMVVGGSVFLDVGLFEHAQRVAQMLATSTMIGEHFKDNIGNILIALNLAHRWKADPFMVMQNVYIVHGKPGLEGKLVIALVNQSGKFTTIQYDFTRNKDGKTTACKAFATEKATGQVLEQTVTWEMVQAEQWDKKKGSKWLTIPDLMFQYRSATWFARVYCPEVLLGMQTTEEIFDFTDMRQGAGGTYSAEPSTADDLTAAIKKKEVVDISHEAIAKRKEERRAKVEQSEEKATTEELLCPYCNAVAQISKQSLLESGTKTYSCASCKKDCKVESGALVGIYPPDKTASNSADPDKVEQETTPDEVSQALKNIEKNATEEVGPTEPDPDKVEQKTNPDTWGEWRKEWINLGPMGFSTYFHKNRADFERAPDELRAEAKAKWERLITKKDGVPWPLDPPEETKAKTEVDPPDEQLNVPCSKCKNTVPAVEIAHGLDSDSPICRACYDAPEKPQDNNRVSMIDAIQGSYNEGEIAKALKSLGREALSGCDLSELGMAYDFLQEHSG